MYKKLTLVTDTALYKKEGEYYGFGPVVREIASIEDMFDEVVWIGFNRTDRIGDLSMQKISSDKTKIIMLKKVGGSGLMSLLAIVLNYPIMFFVILKNCFRADVIHTRAPSHPALIAILLSFFFQRKIWWNKYAGNWNQEKPPLSYGFQKKVLEYAKFSFVTINGFWPNQPKHCFSFENPCLTNDDIQRGIKAQAQKSFAHDFTFAFVGRLSDAKGIPRIIEALRSISPEKINLVHLVGDGPKKDQYAKELAFLGEKVKFHGFLSKDSVHKVLAESHFFLLPSDSEGFPKALAEAACYACIPVASNVGSISHYVTAENGFLWDYGGKESFAAVLSKAVDTNPTELEIISSKTMIIGTQFTFENYKNKLKRNILTF